MKRSKRQQNMILISFVFFTFIFLVIVYVLIVSAYPKILEIKNKKIETQNISTSIDIINKQGLSYSDFVKLNNKTKKSYISELIKNIDETFYKDSIMNNGEGNYADFIQKKKNYFNSEENKEFFLENDLKISSVLPYFSQDYTGDDDEQSLSNFKFISYIERLLETFNLKHNNSLGISEVNIIEDYVSEKGEEKSLEKNIYSIPIKLNLKGTKSGILDFLHYIENVGKIYIDENDELNIYSDDLLTKSNRQIKLEGDILSDDYNIYAHQIIDIENITLPEYMDSSSEYRGTQDYISFIKKTGGKNVIEIKMSLLFYVKGYPQYKLEQLINNILDQYSVLVEDVNDTLKKTDSRDFNYINLKKINNYLKEISDDITLIRKNIKGKNGLEGVYRKTVKYKYIFDNITKLLEKGTIKK